MTTVDRSAWRKSRWLSPEGIPLGCDPSAPVFRGPGRAPFREHASKIRDPRTGLLKPTPSAARGTGGSGHDGSQRMRSTRHFKAQAFEVLARSDLRPIDRQRLLDMVRTECALYRQAITGGGGLDQPLVVEPGDPRRAAGLDRALRYHGWQPGMPQIKLKRPSKRYRKRRRLYDGRCRPRPDARAFMLELNARRRLCAQYPEIAELI